MVTGEGYPSGPESSYGGSAWGGDSLRRSGSGSTVSTVRTATTNMTTRTETTGSGSGSGHGSASGHGRVGRIEEGDEREDIGGRRGVGS